MVLLTFDFDSKQLNGLDLQSEQQQSSSDTVGLDDVSPHLKGGAESGSAETDPKATSAGAQSRASDSARESSSIFERVNMAASWVISAVAGRWRSSKPGANGAGLGSGDSEIRMGRDTTAVSSRTSHRGHSTEQREERYLQVREEGSRERGIDGGREGEREGYDTCR
jgi:hypothetical protein